MMAPSCREAACLPSAKGSHPAMVTMALPLHSFDDDFKTVTSLFFAHLKNTNDVLPAMACALLLPATTATFVPGGCDVIPLHRWLVKLLLPISVTNSVMTLCRRSKSCILAILHHQFCATAQNHAFLQPLAPPLEITHFCHLPPPILPRHLPLLKVMHPAELHPDGRTHQK